MLEIPLLSKVFASAKSRRLDDFVDRLHFEFTVSVLILFAMFIGGKQHFGQPIQCMLPAHLDRWSAYGQYYCFITNTYRLTYNQTVPNAEVRAELREKEGVNLTYYQWVPYFFVVQAFCFYISSWLWRFFQSYSSVDMQTIVDEAVAVRHEIKVEKRNERIIKLVDYLLATFSLRDGFREKHYCWAVKQWSGYSAVTYILSKIVMIFNDFGQLYLIAYFLGIPNIAWALHANQINHENYNFTASYFPRVTFCDLERAVLGGSDKSTLQCVVMLNVINEKLFLLIFYWIVFLIAVSLVNFFYVSFYLLFRREASVKFYIQNAVDNETDFFLKTEKLQLFEFVNNVFGYDGILLLYFLNVQAGSIVTRDVVSRFWRSFLSQGMMTKPFEAKNSQLLGNTGFVALKQQKYNPPIKFGWTVTRDDAAI